ncbi:MAG TPA: peptidoglycan recognition family protein [Longimicrobiaceae bacterium]
MILRPALLLPLLALACAPRPVAVAAAPAAPAPEVVSREAWGAAAPVAPMRAHAVDRITVHHTGTPSQPGRTLEEKLRGLQKYSQSESALAGGRTKPVWPDVPYHFYVGVDGRIAEARRAEYVGDTNTAYDPTGHLLVVVEGNFETERPTPAQLESLRALVGWAARRWSVPGERIGKHDDFADTACPGDHLATHLPALRALAGGPR